MFCRNCGKELAPDTRFCGNCGTPVDNVNPVIQEEKPAPAPTFEETPIPEPIPEPAPAPVSEPAPTPKKKKSGFKKFIISFVAIIAVLGITVAAAFPYVKNFAEKTFLPAEKYYQNVEKSNVKEVSSALAEAFNIIKKSGETAENNLEALNEGKISKSEFDGKKLSSDLSLTLGQPIMELLNNASEMDLSAFSKIGISFDVAENDGLASVGANLSLADSKIISALITATENAEIYAEFPEISDSAIKLDIPKILGFESLGDIYSSPEYSETLQMSIDLIDALPDGEELEKIINRYAEIALKELDSVDKSSEKVSVGDIEISATCLEVEIDEKTLENIVIAVISEFENDEELHDIVDGIMAATGEADKGEFKEYLEESDIFDDIDDQIEGIFEGFGEIVISTYVDAKGNVIGREIEYLGNEISILNVTKGKNAAFEIDVNAQGFNANVFGEGILKKGIFNGFATLEVMSFSVVDIEFVDFDTENLFNGTVILKPAEAISSMLSEYGGGDTSSIVGVLGNSLGIDLAKLSLEIQMESSEEKGGFNLDIKSDNDSLLTFESGFEITDAGKIKIPDEVIEIENERDFDRWIETISGENLPDEILEILEAMGEEEAVEYPYYEEDFESFPEEPVYPDNALFLATCAGFPPFIYHDDYGNLTGIDIEIASAIAIEMGMVLYVEEVDFDSLTHSVANGDNHIAMSALTATEEKLEVADFSDYYICNTQVVLVRDDYPLTSFNELYQNTYRIGVKNSTTAIYYATEDFGVDNVYIYDTYENLVGGLKNGFVDVIILDYPYAVKFDEEIEGVRRLTSDYSFEPYCIAVSKDNPELKARINEAIINLRNNGVLSEIYNRYINDVPVVPYVTVSPIEDEYEYDYEYDYDDGYVYDDGYEYDENDSGIADSMFDYSVDAPTSAFDNSMDFGYRVQEEEPVTDDYYYNDYYYSDRHTEDYYANSEY